MKKVIALIGSILLLAGCSSSSSAVDLSVNEFSAKLVQTCDRKDVNVVLSPFSMYSALAMLEQGAKGPTDAELIELLRVPAIKEEDQW